MKKFIAMVMACLMVVGGLAGCSKTEEAAATNLTLTVWGPQAELGENKAGWLPQWCEAFNQAHPEWNITFRYEVCGEGDAGTNVTKDPTVAGDIYFFANDQLGTLLQANAIARLGGATLEQVKADNSEAMVATVSSGEGVYGVPFTSNTWFMYYNSAIFTQEDVKSLDRMLEVAKEKGVKVSFPLTTGWYFGAFYAANGGTYFGDGTDAAAGIQFGGEKGVAVTNYLVDLVANPNFMDDASGAGMSGLKDGSVAAIFSGTWDAGNTKEALGENWAAAAAPTITIGGEAKQLLGFHGSKAIAVNPNCKNPQVAAALAAFLATPEAQLAHYEFNGTAPVSKQLADNATVTADVSIKAANDAVAYASVMQPSIPEMNPYWDVAQAMAKAIINGEVTHENAQAQTEQFNTALNNTGL